MKGHFTPHTLESRKKMSNSIKAFYTNGGVVWNKGKKGLQRWSEERKRKYSFKVSDRLKKQTKMAALQRWKGHIAKPKQQKKRLWKITHNPILQLEKKRFRNQRYKARKKMNGGSHTFEEWLVVKIFYKNMCLCCKRQEPEIKLTEDHIIPSFMGGSDDIENIQPLCQSCNTRKHIKKTDYRYLFIGGGEYQTVVN